MEVILREILFKATFACLFLAMSGCIEETHLKAQISSNDIGVIVDVVNVKPFSENGTEKSLVYGSLAFEDLKHIAARVNLTCIAISIGDIKSENIYVDSVAYILPESYKLNGDQKKVSVYWKMNKQLNAGSAGKELKVFIREGCNLLMKA